MRRTRGWGFTLIELLVVIAIIAILAAILFPIFLSAKNRAKIAACTERHQQLGKAWQSYCSDWNEWSCFGSTTETNPPRWVYWSERLQKYTGKSMSVSYCAALPLNTVVRSPLFLDGNMWGTSIGINMIVGCGWGGPYTPLKVTSVGAPSRTVLFTCTSYINYNKDTWNSGWTREQAAMMGDYITCPGAITQPALVKAERVNPGGARYNPYPYIDMDRHGGIGVVTFMDGHVATMPWNKLLSPQISNWRDWKNPRFSLWDLY